MSRIGNLTFVVNFIKSGEKRSPNPILTIVYPNVAYLFFEMPVYKNSCLNTSEKYFYLRSYLKAKSWISVACYFSQASRNQKLQKYFRF